MFIYTNLEICSVPGQRLAHAIQGTTTAAQEPPARANESPPAELGPSNYIGSVDSESEGLAAVLAGLAFAGVALTGLALARLVALAVAVALAVVAATVAVAVALAAVPTAVAVPAPAPPAAAVVPQAEPRSESGQGQGTDQSCDGTTAVVHSASGAALNDLKRERDIVY